jgi:hypothetical protein
MILAIFRARITFSHKKGTRGVSLPTLGFSLSLYPPLVKMKQLENTWIPHRFLRETSSQETTRRPCESIVLRMTNKILLNSLLINKKIESQLITVQIKETFMHPFKIL